MKKKRTIVARGSRAAVAIEAPSKRVMTVANEVFIVCEISCRGDDYSGLGE